MNRFMLAVFSTLLIGCGGSDGEAEADASTETVDAGPTVDGAPQLATLEDVCGESGLFVDLIHRFEECLPEFAVFVGSFPDDATVAMICNDGQKPYLDDGSIMLGPASLLASCTTALEAADCTTFDFDGIEECQGLLVGQIPPGGECDNSDVCSEGLYCDQSGSNDCGFCAVLKPDGNNCVHGGQCLNGVCVRGQCTGDGLAGSPCRVKDHCHGRLVCDGTTMMCTDPATYQVDDDCTGFDNQCGIPFSGLYCGGSKCQQLGGIGDDCTVGFTKLCDVFAGLTCDGNTLKCVNATEVADGQACNILAGTKCMSGSVCATGGQGVDGICEPFKANGEACAPGDEVGCAPFLECVNGMCQAGRYTGLCSPD
jgi:hypothetical protein